MVTLQIPVLFADDVMVAVDKPAGLATVPAPDAPAGECVRAVVERQLGVRLWVVHRLDRETSGVLLFARTAEAHRSLCLAFDAREVRKTYVAFTFGAPPSRDGRIDTPLHPARRGKVRPARPGEAGAWHTSTRFVVRKRWERGGDAVALVEAHPETGRHHQIRAHLRSIGAPVLFDRLYGRASAAIASPGAPVARLALHASRLAVPDPAKAGLMRTYEAPLPADLVALLHWLDADWTAVMVEATSSPG
jgi:tRNA pseudouridine32 synthase / 23S rRNA pseudouridine746 synthase